MKSRSYDQAALIDAYIEAQKKHFLHSDFEDFAQARLQALEQAFGITFSWDDIQPNVPRSLFVLFKTTVDSLLALRVPRSNMLDDSLLNKQLEAMGDRASKINQLEGLIVERYYANLETHRELINELFEMLWGKRERVVTSEELLAFGFDENAEPNIGDYLDYY